MTESRIRELAQELADRILPNLAPKPVTVALAESALRSFWNEAVEECANTVSARPASPGYCDHDALIAIAMVIRSLKFPEGKP